MPRKNGRREAFHGKNSPTSILINIGSLFAALEKPSQKLDPREVFSEIITEVERFLGSPRTEPSERAVLRDRIIANLTHWEKTYPENSQQISRIRRLFVARTTGQTIGVRERIILKRALERREPKRPR